MLVNLNYPQIGSITQLYTTTQQTILGLQLVSWDNATEFVGGTSSGYCRSNAVFSRYPAAVVDQDKLLEYTWYDEEYIIGTGSYGTIVLSYITDSLSSLGASSTAQFSAGTIGFTVTIAQLGSGTSAVFYLGSHDLATVAWSNIGSLTFTQGRDNVAGSRPLDWQGNVYAILALGNKCVAYGTNGVSFLLPSGNTYGLNTVYPVGLKGKGAVTGSNSKHFFIDSSGNLIEVADGLSVLDYKEFLSSLSSSVVMSYDVTEDFIYICDGVLGFIYSVKDRSLGKGPTKITSIGIRSGVKYIGAPETIADTTFEICTDVVDLGSRAGKTIYSLEVGTDVTSALYAAISYRRNKASTFTQTSWYPVSAHGRVFISAYGIEFKIHLKVLSYTYFEVDYIKVNGVVNDY